MNTNFQPIVTIVIPVYNGSNYMRVAIDSALNQTYKKIEIIVINDGSIDSTNEIALSYGERIRYFNKVNGGVSSALNLAIKNMRGDYFSWLSHDDVYYPEKIEKQIDFIANLSRRTIIYSASDLIDKHGNVIKNRVGVKEIKNPLMFQLLFDRFIGGCSLLIPKQAFDEVGIFDEKLKAIQDYEMWFRMMRGNFEFRCLSVLTGATRIHSQQTSIAQENMCAEEDFLVYKDIINKTPVKLLTGKDIREEEVYYRLAYQYKISGRDKLYSFCLSKADQLNAECRANFRIFYLRWKAKIYNKYLNPVVYIYWIHKKLIKPE